MERYSRIYLLPQELYTAGCPVLIKAGALLKDNAVDKILAQLKFKNVGEKAIREIVVSIDAYDESGAALQGATEFCYKQLGAAVSAEFGSQTPIILPDNATRSFGVAVKKVVFADNTVWEAGELAAATAITAEQSKELAVKQEEQKYEKKRSGAKKFAVLPLVLAGVAIVFELIALMYLLFVMYKGAPQNVITTTILSNLKIGNLIAALILPALTLILVMKSKSKGLFKLGTVVSFVVVGLQILSALILVVVLFRGGMTPILSKLVAFNGNQLFNALVALVKGSLQTKLYAFIRLIFSACYIAKNIFCGIACAKMSK